MKNTFILIAQDQIPVLQPVPSLTYLDRTSETCY